MKTELILHPRLRENLLNQGISHFNDARYFEAHEVWENLWKLESGQERVFLQGLIQCAGHFVHIIKGNHSGAQSLASAALTKMSTPIWNESPYYKFDWEPVTSALQYNLELFSHPERITNSDSFLFPRIF